MSVLFRLTATETRLFLREPIVVFFAVAFAPILLVVLGLVPSMWNLPRSSAAGG